MNDYSDLIFLIAAIAIYGLLVNNTNRSLVLNNQILNDSEIEYSAIAVAQDILEEARWEKYNDLNCSTLLDELDQSEYRSEVFEADCSITTLPSSACPTSDQCKRVSATIESDFLLNGDGTRRTISMSLIKTNY